MDDSDIGKYIKLLSVQWDKGRIPKKRLGFIVKIFWNEFSDELKEKFESDEQFIWNQRLEDERTKREKFKIKQSINGKKGGRPQKNKTQKKPLEDESESEKENKNEKEYELFNEITSFFDEKLVNEKIWLDCYDKLIRIDGYSEHQIKEIVKEFRSDGNWWKDTGNFESLLKLRKKNNEGVKYIDLFNKKLSLSSRLIFSKSAELNKDL